MYKNESMDFLDLLKRVDHTDERLKQILELEMSINLLLPPIIKLFFQLYEGGNFIETSTFKYYSESLNRKRGFCEIIPGANFDFLIYQFMPLDEIVLNMEKVYPSEHIVWKENLIPIAETSGQGYILISLKSETRDEVYIDFQGEDNIKFIANNIFELLINTKVEILDRKIKDGNVKDLYRKWSEDFWRLSE